MLVAVTYVSRMLYRNSYLTFMSPAFPEEQPKQTFSQFNELSFLIFRWPK